MRSLLGVSTLAVLALGAYAQADEISSTSEQQTAQASPQAVYEGVDADGRPFKLTLSNGGPQLLVRVDRAAALAAPHWTSLIGTGAAASVER